MTLFRHHQLYLLLIYGPDQYVDLLFTSFFHSHYVLTPFSIMCRLRHITLAASIFTIVSSAKIGPTCSPNCSYSAGGTLMSAR